MTNGTDYTDYTLSAASPDDLTAGLAALPGLNPGRVFDAVVTVPECAGEGEGAEVVAYRAALRILDGGGPLVAGALTMTPRGALDPGFMGEAPGPARPGAAEVRAETLRRLLLAFNARDERHLAIKVQDATIEAGVLTDRIARGESLTPAEQRAADHLRGAVTLYRAIKACGNAMEAEALGGRLDGGFTRDGRWPA